MINLLKNGDFNLVGEFTTDYQLLTQAQGAGTAAVVTAPPNWGLGSTTGHGGAGDKFLMVDGAQDANKAFWKQSVVLEQGKTYEFSFWVNANDEVNLQLQVNGQDVGAAMATQTGTGWKKVSVQFTAQQSGAAALGLRGLATHLGGNDFGIDDLSLTLVTPGVTNLISNGDFNASGGFTTDYQLLTQAQGAGTAAVVTAPPNWGLGSTTGHGGAGDKFLMVDGAQDANKAFWKQSVVLEQGKTYEFSFWVNANDEVNLQLQVNGQDVGAAMATQTGTGWKKVSVQFTAQQSGAAALGLRGLATHLGGNDFGIDDLSLTLVASTLSLSQADGLVAENTTYTSVVPTLTGAPVGLVTYSLGGADAGLFSVNTNTGVVSMAARNFEAPVNAGSNNIYDYTLIATDSNGNTASRAVQVGVTNVNEAPTAITLTGNSITENTAIGAGVLIGQINVSDPDASGNNNILSLSGADAASFQIRNGALYYVGTSPDFEAKSSYAVTVTSTDGSLVKSQAFTVNVNNVNEAPTAITLSGNSITENTAIGAGVLIGQINVSDPDASGNNNILSLSGADAASFQIRNGALYYVGASPNFEAKSSYAVTVTSTDGSLVKSQAFTVNVNDVHETSIDLTSLTTAQFASLTAAQLSALTAVQVATLSAEKIGVLTDVKIQSLKSDGLSYAQLSYLNSQDYTLLSALSTTQLHALSTQVQAQVRLGQMLERPSAKIISSSDLDIPLSDTAVQDGNRVYFYRQSYLYKVGHWNSAGEPYQVDWFEQNHLSKRDAYSAGRLTQVDYFDDTGVRSKHDIYDYDQSGLTAIRHYGNGGQLVGTDTKQAGVVTRTITESGTGESVLNGETVNLAAGKKLSDVTFSGGQLNAQQGKLEGVIAFEGKNSQLVISTATDFKGEITGFGDQEGESIRIVGLDATKAKLSGSGQQWVITDGTNTVSLPFAGSLPPVSQGQLVADGNGGVVLSLKPRVKVIFELDQDPATLAAIQAQLAQTGTDYLVVKCQPQSKGGMRFEFSSSQTLQAAQAALARLQSQDLDPDFASLMLIGKATGYSTSDFEQTTLGGFTGAQLGLMVSQLSSAGLADSRVGGELSILKRLGAIVFEASSMNGLPGSELAYMELTQAVSSVIHQFSSTYKTSTGIEPRYGLEAQRASALPASTSIEQIKVKFNEALIQKALGEPSEGGTTRYKLIVLTGKDLTGIDASAYLMSKYSDKATVLYWDGENYSVIAGEENWSKAQAGQVDWTIVGHGKAAAGEGDATLGGMSSQQLSESLARLNTKLLVDHVALGNPTEVDLMACNLLDGSTTAKLMGGDAVYAGYEDFGSRFAYQFATNNPELETVTARSGTVWVDIAGASWAKTTTTYANDGTGLFTAETSQQKIEKPTDFIFESSVSLGLIDDVNTLQRGSFRSDHDFNDYDYLSYEEIGLYATLRHVVRGPSNHFTVIVLASEEEMFRTTTSNHFYYITENYGERAVVVGVDKDGNTKILEGEMNPEGLPIHLIYEGGHGRVNHVGGYPPETHARLIDHVGNAWGITDQITSIYIGACNTEPATIISQDNSRSFGFNFLESYIERTGTAPVVYTAALPQFGISGAAQVGFSLGFRTDKYVTAAEMPAASRITEVSGEYIVQRPLLGSFNFTETRNLLWAGANKPLSESNKTKLQDSHWSIFEAALPGFKESLQANFVGKQLSNDKITWIVCLESDPAVLKDIISETQKLNTQVHVEDVNGHVLYSSVPAGEPVPNVMDVVFSGQFYDYPITGKSLSGFNPHALAEYLDFIRKERGMGAVIEDVKLGIFASYDHYASINLTNNFETGKVEFGVDFLKNVQDIKGLYIKDGSYVVPKEAVLTRDIDGGKYHLQLSGEQTPSEVLIRQEGMHDRTVILAIIDTSGSWIELKKAAEAMKSQMSSSLQEDIYYYDVETSNYRKMNAKGELVLAAPPRDLNHHDRLMVLGYGNYGAEYEAFVLGGKSNGIGTFLNGSRLAGIVDPFIDSKTGIGSIEIIAANSSPTNVEVNDFAKFFMNKLTTARIYVHEGVTLTNAVIQVTSSGTPIYQGKDPITGEPAWFYGVENGQIQYTLSKEGVGDYVSSRRDIKSVSKDWIKMPVPVEGMAGSSGVLTSNGYKEFLAEYKSENFNYFADKIYKFGENIYFDGDFLFGIGFGVDKVLFNYLHAKNWVSHRERVNGDIFYVLDTEKIVNIDFDIRSVGRYLQSNFISHEVVSQLCLIINLMDNQGTRFRERDNYKNSALKAFIDAFGEEGLPQSVNLTEEQLRTAREAISAYEEANAVALGGESLSDVQTVSAQVVDSVVQAQMAVAHDIQLLGDRIRQQIERVGGRYEDVVRDSFEFVKETGKLTLKVKVGQAGELKTVEIDTAGLEFESKRLMNASVDAIHEATAHSGTASNAAEGFSQGMGAIITLRSLQGVFEGLSQGDLKGAGISAAWATYGLAGLVGADRVLIDGLGKGLGSVFFSEAQATIETMDDFLAAATRSFLMSMGVESAELLSMSGNLVAKFPVIAIAFSAWIIYQDVDTLERDEASGMPKWKTDLDKADLSLDVVSSALQIVAPFTGPAAPFLMAAAMFVMGVRMTVDDLVMDEHSGHPDHAKQALAALSFMAPLSMLERGMEKVFGRNEVLMSVSNIDNLFKVETETKNLEDGKTKQITILDLTRGNLLTEEELKVKGNPAIYAGHLTVDFSRVGKEGGQMLISGQHAPSSGMLTDVDNDMVFSGSREVDKGIDYVMLGSGASYTKDGELLPGAASARERIIANAQNNIFATSSGDTKVTDINGREHLYRYEIDAGRGKDVLYIAQGLYQFEGGADQDMIIGSRLVLDSDNQILVWDLSEQRVIPNLYQPDTWHRFLTVLDEAKMTQALAGDIQTVDQRTLLSNTRIAAHSVEGVVGSYAATVYVLGGPSFRTYGAVREVFIGNDQDETISTGGGDDVIYLSGGNDKYLIERSHSLHSENLDKYPAYATDAKQKAALLAAELRKDWLYTEVKLVVPKNAQQDATDLGNDAVILDGAIFNQVQIIEKENKEILIGYGQEQNANGLYVRVANRAVLKGLNFLTDDGVLFKIANIDNQNENLTLDIESVDANSYVAKHYDDLYLKQEETENGFETKISPYLTFELPTAWKTNSFDLGVEIDEIDWSLGRNSFNELVIHAKDISKTNHYVSLALNDGNKTALTIRTLDNNVVSLEKNSSGVWAIKNTAVFDWVVTTPKSDLTAELNAIVTQGAGGLNKDISFGDAWKYYSPAAPTSLVQNNNQSGQNLSVTNNLYMTADRDGGFFGGVGNDSIGVSLGEAGVSLLDGGLGIDTYMLKRGNGVVSIVDEGSHVTAQKTSTEASRIVFADVNWRDLRAEVGQINVQGGVTQNILTLTAAVENDQKGITVKFFEKDLVNYQFIAADGVSLVYKMGDDGRLFETIVGFDQNYWNQVHASKGTSASDAAKAKQAAQDLAELLYRLTGRYDGSDAAETVVLNHEGLYVATGKGNDVLHMRANVGGVVVLKAGDGHKRVYLDSQQTQLKAQEIDEPLVDNNRLMGVRKEIWSGVQIQEAATAPSLQSQLDTAFSRASDWVENDADLSGVLRSGQLVRLKGQRVLAGGHTYFFKDFATDVLSLEISGGPAGRYKVEKQADGSVAVVTTDGEKITVDFTLVSWASGLVGSYDLRYKLEQPQAVSGQLPFDYGGAKLANSPSNGTVIREVPDSGNIIVVSDLGDWDQPSLKGPTVDKNSLLTLSFQGFSEDQMRESISLDGKTLTLSAGHDDQEVSVTIDWADYGKYQVLTKNGMVWSIQSSGRLNLERVELSMQLTLDTVNLNSVDGLTKLPDMWLTVNGDGHDNVVIAHEDQTLLFQGYAGDDVVKGSKKGDVFVLGLGNDIALGEDGNDAFIGGDGADVMDGGEGVDVVTYMGDRENQWGVWVNLIQGRAWSADAQGDILRNIESVIGSAYSDTLIGNAQTQVLEGREGNDILSAPGSRLAKLIGGAGADSYLVRSGDQVLISKKLSLGSSKNDTSQDVVVMDVAGTLSWHATANGGLAVTGSDFVMTLGDWFLNAESRNYVFVLRGTNAADSRKLVGDEFEFWLKTGANRTAGGVALSAEEYQNYQALLQLDSSVAAPQDVIGTTGNDSLIGSKTQTRLFGLGGDDTFKGTKQGNWIDGGEGSDTVSYENSLCSVWMNLSQPNSQGLVFGMGNGDDQGDILYSIENLRGSSYDDILIGDAKNNVIEGGGGADVLQGGDGFDLLSYANSVAYFVPEYDDRVHAREGQKGKNIGVYVDLASGEACRGDAGVVHRDKISGFEGIIGSRFADDFFGDEGHNLFIPNGYDSLTGERDVIDGRGGTDTVSFAGYENKLNITVGRDGYAVWANGAGLVATLKNIENAIGTNFNDRFVGDDQNNRFEGGGGSDRFEGHGGQDFFVGGAGYDDYYIFKGDRVTISQAGNGNSIDRVSFEDVQNFKEELIFQKMNQDLLITTKDNQTSVVLQGWLSGDSLYTITNGWTSYDAAKINSVL